MSVSPALLLWKDLTVTRSLAHPLRSHLLTTQNENIGHPALLSARSLAAQNFISLFLKNHCFAGSFNFVSGMPKTATSQKGSTKKHKHTSTAVTSMGQSRARNAAAVAAKKNSHQGGKPRRKLSHQQAAQTRDLLDAEFRDLRIKTMGHQEDPRQREGAAAAAGFSAHVSEESVQDLASIMSAL